MSNKPLVSIGLPTYNRASDLKRCIDSVLAQDYSNFELIISDNASTDRTQSLCEEFYRKDRRIRYIRQPNNNGAGANFKVVRREAQGEFFMWLGDDDWLDRCYVGECMRVLADHADHELVCGRGRYFDGEKLCFAEVATNLHADSRSQRVLSYYQQVGMNGMFYGVMRRKIVSSLEIRDTLGGDWLLMGQIAYLGKVRTLEGVFVNRSIAGASQSVEKLALAEGLPRIVARNAHLLVALKIFKDIAWKSPVYKPLGRLRRISLAVRSAVAVARKYCVPVWPKKLLEALKRLGPLKKLQVIWNNLRAQLILRTRLKRGLQSIKKKSLRTRNTGFGGPAK